MQKCLKRKVVRNFYKAFVTNVVEYKNRCKIFIFEIKTKILPFL